jgi:uncharacterized RDD family membrane protein YckC
MQPYGGFWLRFVAYFIDAIILNIASSAIGMVFGFTATFTNISQDVAVGSLATVFGLNFLVNWLYHAVLTSSQWQATVGKKAMSLVVTDKNGHRISFGRATARYFAQLISALILLIGYFMIGWTRRKEGLHDMIAGTLVYKSNAPELLDNAAEVFS